MADDLHQRLRRIDKLHATDRHGNHNMDPVQLLYCSASCANASNRLGVAVEFASSQNSRCLQPTGIYSLLVDDAPDQGPGACCGSGMLKKVWGSHATLQTGEPEK